MQRIQGRTRFRLQCSGHCIDFIFLVHAHNVDLLAEPVAEEVQVEDLGEALACYSICRFEQGLVFDPTDLLSLLNIFMPA